MAASLPAGAVHSADSLIISSSSSSYNDNDDDDDDDSMLDIETQQALFGDDSDRNTDDEDREFDLSDTTGLRKIVNRPYNQHRRFAIGIDNDRSLEKLENARSRHRDSESDDQSAQPDDDGDPTHASSSAAQNEESAQLGSDAVAMSDDDDASRNMALQIEGEYQTPVYPTTSALAVLRKGELEASREQKRSEHRYAFAAKNRQELLHKMQHNRRPAAAASATVSPPQSAAAAPLLARPAAAATVSKGERLFALGREETQLRTNIGQLELQCRSNQSRIQHVEMAKLSARLHASQNAGEREKEVPRPRTDQDVETEYVAYCRAIEERNYKLRLQQQIHANLSPQERESRERDACEKNKKLDDEKTAVETLIQTHQLSITASTQRIAEIVEERRQLLQK